MIQKAIILAGGAGTRLLPTTKAVNKHLLPVYNKPMIYYPISTAMLAGAREIAIVSTAQAIPQLKQLLGEDTNLGVDFYYIEEKEPMGLAAAVLLCRDFIGGDSVMVVLGDNLFHGQSLRDLLRYGARIAVSEGEACIYGYPVSNPDQYGIVYRNKNGIPTSIVEKPRGPHSIPELAVPGLYFYDETATDRISELKSSERGELEITALNQSYLQEDVLKVVEMSRGMAWLDMGTPEDLLRASQYVQIMEERQGLKIGDLQEIARTKGWIK